MTIHYWYFIIGCRLPPMAISREERLQRKRIAAKKRRDRLYKDPELRDKENQKRRQRYQEKRSQKEPAKQKAARRAKYRDDKRKYSRPKQENSSFELYVSTRADSIRRKAKLRADKLRVKKNYLLKKEIKKNELLRRRLEKYKKRWNRFRNSNTANSISPRSLLNRNLERRKEVVSSHIRRRLLFAECIQEEVKESFSRIRSSKTKKMIANNLTFKYVKEYRFLREAKPFFPYNSFRCSSEKRRFIGVKRQKMKIVEDSVRAFYEDDSTSTLSPAKAHQIVKNGIKKL